MIGELGRGGMGVVFRARDLTMHREVALKSMWPSFASQPDYRQRFLREARAASRLSHPNIVPVFEAFEEGGLPWIVMPLVRGRSLRALLAEVGRLPPEQVVRLGTELASALHGAHGARVLHRDITPNNVLLDDEGRAMLVDFGLARILPGGEDGSTGPVASTSLTGSGMTVGTPGYMSPEQALGKQLDGRSDLFSLGAVLYLACTGKAPFSAANPGEVLDAILHREPEPIARFTYEVPDELERIVRKALARRADERFQTAADLHADLRALWRRLDSGGAAQAFSAPPASRRSRALLAAGAVAAAAASVALVLWLWTRGPATPAHPAGVPRQVTSFSGWEAEPAVSPDATTIAPDDSAVAYVSNRWGKYDLWLQPLAAGRPTGPPRRLTDQPGEVSLPAFSPDGRWIAYHRNLQGQRDVMIVDVAGSPPVVFADDPTIDLHPDWSPDGTALVYASERDGRSHLWAAGVRDGRRTSPPRKLTSGAADDYFPRPPVRVGVRACANPVAPRGR